VLLAGAKGVDVNRIMQDDHPIGIQLERLNQVIGHRLGLADDAVGAGIEQTIEKPRGRGESIEG
jgi:hypothetical protein